MQTLLRPTVTIPGRYCGPPGFVNGGIAAGAFAVAAGLGRAAEVTLHRPVPVDQDLDPQEFATVAPVDLGAWVPVGADLAAAETAAACFPREKHYFPGCYVCGPNHPDGLGILPGPLPGGRAVASPWRVPDDPTAAMVWGALDCPSGWAAYFGAANPVPAVLGRLAVQIDRLPLPGETLVVTGWQVAEQERRLLTGSALHTPGGSLVARARATWIKLSPEQVVAFGVSA